MRNKLFVPFELWLDNHYTPCETGDFRSRYDGAVDMLRSSGLEVSVIPAAKSVVHVIRKKKEVAK